MKRKVVKYTLLCILILLIITAISSFHDWIVCGNQTIKISTSTKAYTNSDLYVSLIAQGKGENLDTKTKVKLVDSRGKKVKKVNVKYDGNNAILSIPEIEEGNYFIEAKVSSKAGKDKIQKEVYISKGKSQNVTITLDKGIYKPGDTVNYRALLTNKEDDKPLSEDINVSIYDGNDNRVYNENVKTSDYGIISGSFSIADEVNSGIYKLTVKTDNNETTKQFKVNPYVTPKYEVKINNDKENYLVGEKAKVDFNAKYFFGEAVKDAKLTVYVNNEKYSDLKSDAQGNATMMYEIKKAGTYNIKVEAVDTSNYYVEQTSSFSAGTDIFEIELLPENETLIYGQKNEVYVFTSKADGTPVKSNVTVTSNTFTKQIATDENGVGSFTIDINQNSSRIFIVNAEDSEGNKIKKEITLKVEQKNLILNTDKVKYSQGEDIKIKTPSKIDNSKIIYLLKNDKLLKLINTDLDETEINLDDTYGLIDIYVTDTADTIKNSITSTNTYKRTIFIKPTKQLNIDIKTDKDEYKPGEKINISFNTKNENKDDIDAALLVSMLDNSILNLANNDLSIDNIKMALQDIKLSDELDAATLYSCIIDDSSEQTLKALLLRQSNNNPNISQSSIVNYEQEGKAIIIAIISSTIIAIIIIGYLYAKFPVIRIGLKHIINYLVYNLTLVLMVRAIIDEYFWRLDFSGLGVLITSIIGLATYIGLVSRISDKLFRTSISLIITSVVSILLLYIIEELEFSAIILLLILAVLLLIIAVISRINKLKEFKFGKIVQKETKYILKYIGALVISAIIGNIVESILDIYMISVPVLIIVLFCFNYLFNIRNKNEINSNDNTREKILYVALSILAIIIIMIVGYGIISIFDYRVVNNSRIDDIYTFDESPSMNSKSKSRKGINPGSFSDSDSASNSGVMDFLEEAGDALTSGKDNKTDTIEKSDSEQIKESVTDDNVRNVFLESMCFIPELITSNGAGKVDLNLSDNITTWTIQTIGNTKDGRIGYNSLNNVKVFKDFFVDFELPKNLVETDKVKIPLTVYNYTDNTINTTIKIKEEDWFTLENNNINISIDAKSTNMAYVPITIKKKGNNKFRAEVSSDSLTDIVEKECVVTPKGHKVEKVVSTGTLDGDISEDILFLDDTIEDTKKAKVKIYASTISQTVEGMENIFKMPTGCFEQVSSSLYPNILALKYLEDNGIVNDEIKDKAKSYISAGYQKLLAYEVKGESGGYSLYGDSPAETVLTAYGLMEITDLSEVYSVDSNVINKMTEFLYKKQKTDGTFTITGSHIGGANSRETVALNAYITWALSESNPKDTRLNKSVEYLKSKLSDIDDNYTLALIANTLANVKDKESKSVIKRLVNNVNIENNSAYLNSDIIDYYGTRGNIQTVQTVALTSMALSKNSQNQDINKMLINYIISQKDTRGTWYSTQATILALKALNENTKKSILENQTIVVKVNSEEQKIEIKDNPLEYYELTFENLNKENKLDIDIEKGNAYYEVVEEYYIPYDKVKTTDDNIELLVENNNNLKVNDILKTNIRAINKSKNNIENGMITISIPQGFTVIEESLMLLENKGIIEKYEMSYTEINIYLRKFEASQIVNLNIDFRASYPVEITGLSIKAYDYYNPFVEGKTMPRELKVNE